jgi:nucleoside-diphosphate-sugar epimerase
MRILLTGATGFIGSHLAPRLATEHEVIALVRRQPAAPQPDIHYILQDLAEPLDSARLPQQVDAVIHQAAMIETSRAGNDAMPFLINVVATWRLMNYAQQAAARVFLHASTGGIYGCRDRPFIETDPPNPMDLYSLTKSQAELAVRHADAPFPKVILRYFFPYGIGTPNPIPTYVRRALRGEPIQVTANHKPEFNPIHISDAVEATVAALSLEQDEVINIAGMETTSFAAIAELAAPHAQRSPIFEIIPDHATIPYYRAGLVADTTHMQRALHFTPTIDLETGIAGMAAVYMLQE